jgi:membrane-bound serine protease (ClpP class)
MVVVAQIDGVVDPTILQASLSVSEVVRAIITDPNVAFLLLILGALGIVAEIYHPGVFFPGIVGMLALLLAFVGLGSLPTNWGAAALLGFALLLLILELHLPSHGVLGAGGVVSFLLGGFLLFAQPAATAPTVETIEVNRWLLLATSAGFAAFFLLALRAGLRARSLPVIDPLTRLTGALGTARSVLAPSGTVLILNESWSAVTAGAPIEPGERVQVVSREGLTLRVRRLASVPAREWVACPSQGEVRPGLRVERTG